MSAADDPAVSQRTADPDGVNWLSSLKAISDVLVEFGKSPSGFILGALLSQLLGGVQTVIEALLGGIQTLILGADGRPSAELGTEETIGIADLPLTFAAGLGEAGNEVLSPIIGTLTTLSAEASAIAQNAGPLAPLVYTGMVVLVIAAAVWLLRTGISVLADAIPGVQGVIR